MLLNIFRQSVCSWRNSEARRGASCLTQSVWALVQHFGCNEAIVLRSTCQPLRKLDICKFDSICVANWAWDDMRINWLLDTNVLCHQCRSNTAGGAAFETKKHTARNRVPRSYHAETHYFHVRSFNLCCCTHPSQFARQANVEIVDAARDTNYNIYFIIFCIYYIFPWCFPLQTKGVRTKPVDLRWLHRTPRLDYVCCPIVRHQTHLCHRYADDGSNSVAS